MNLERDRIDSFHQLPRIIYVKFIDSKTFFKDSKRLPVCSFNYITPIERMCLVSAIIVVQNFKSLRVSIDFP